MNTLNNRQISKRIVENMRIERLKKGYSQEYMALQLNISQNAYSRMERGMTKIDLERLVQIGYLLDLRSYQLLQLIAISLAEKGSKES